MPQPLDIKSRLSLKEQLERQYPFLRDLSSYGVPTETPKPTAPLASSGAEYTYGRGGEPVIMGQGMIGSQDIPTAVLDELEGYMARRGIRLPAKQAERIKAHQDKYLPPSMRYTGPEQPAESVTRSEALTALKDHLATRKAEWAMKPSEALTALKDYLATRMGEWDIQGLMQTMSGIPDAPQATSQETAFDPGSLSEQYVRPSATEGGVADLVKTTDDAARKRRLEGLQGIAEGLGNIDLKHWGEYYLRTPPTDYKPYVAGGIRQELSEIEDREAGEKFTNLLRSIGIEPPGDAKIPMSVYREIMPVFVEQERTKRERESTAAQERIYGARAFAEAEKEAETLAREEEKEAEKLAREEEKETRAGVTKKEDRLNNLASEYRQIKAPFQVTLDAANKTLRLLDQGNLQGARAAAFSLARTFDPGRLSEQDVQMFATEGGVEGWFNNLQSKLTGIPSQRWVRQARRIAQISKEAAGEELSAATEDFIVGRAGLYNYEPDEIRKSIGAVRAVSVGKIGPDPNVNVLRKDGKVVPVPRSQAELMLQRGFIKEILPGQ